MTEDERTCNNLLIARTYMYTLFHKVFGGEPTTELLELLGGSTVAEVFAVFSEDGDVLEKCSSYLRDHFGTDGGEDETLLEQCVNEYIAVVYGFPNPTALPSESFYCSSDHSQLSEVTLAVRDCYRSFGLLPVRYPRIPDDHLALEMDFMAGLSERTATLFVERDWKGLVGLLQSQAAFLDKHLNAWLPDFACDMRKRKQAYLYPQLAQAAEAFVALDRQCLNNIAAWLAEQGEEMIVHSEEEAADSSPEQLQEALKCLRSLRLPHLEDGELAAVA